MIDGDNDASYDDDESGAVDPDLIAYLSAMLSEGHDAVELSEGGVDVDGPARESMAPFLEGMGVSDDLIGRAVMAVVDLASEKLSGGGGGGGGGGGETAAREE